MCDQISAGGNTVNTDINFLVLGGGVTGFHERRIRRKVGVKAGTQNWQGLYRAEANAETGKYFMLFHSLCLYGNAHSDIESMVEVAIDLIN
jgi:hypothetical protein